MSVVRAIWVSAAFATMLIASAPLQVLIVLAAPRLQHVLPQRVFAAAAHIMGATLTVRGSPPSGGPHLLVANHVSWIDIIAIGAVVPCQFIAKRDVRSWPIFGPLSRLIRTCFVDRERRNGVSPVRREMTDRWTAGDILVLFPEGTSTDGSDVLPFKSALFPGADSGTPPVQPLTLSYGDRQGRNGTHYGWYADMDLMPHMWHVFKGGPFEVRLDFHPILSAEQAPNRKAQAACAEAMVREGLALAQKGAKETS